LSNILIISEDTVGKMMAGPAIRCVEMAKALGQDHSVVLAVPESGKADLPQIPSISIAVYDNSSLPDLVAKCDVVVIFGYLVRKFPFLEEIDKPTVVDIYDPFVLENLEIHRCEEIKQRVETHFFDLGILNQLLRIGDFFICASEKQRDFWLGLLTALGRINPLTYDDDSRLRRLIDVVPFGIPEDPPTHSRQTLKGVHPGIKQEDKVILWGGGIYNWFDPLTLIRAIDKIASKRDDVKLFFMGVRHPNPDIPQMKMCAEAIKLSEELKLKDKYVFFNQWAAYEDRQNFLLEADIGISTHLEHLETEFSFRTRVLDYIWAGLPVITTEGDFIASLVEQKDLGIVVDYEDPDQLATAITQLLDDADLHKRCRENLIRIASDYTWKNATRPLNKFCQEPVFAPDKNDLALNYINKQSPEPINKTTGSYVRKFTFYLREEGIRSTTNRLKRFTRRRLSGK